MASSILPEPKRGKGIISSIESKEQHRRSLPEYKRFITNNYDGVAGHLTSITGVLTGHETLAGKMFGPKGFQIQGCKRILDAACGNGRYTKFLLKKADPDALITAFDLSQSMLRRARRRLHSPRVSHVSADLTHLPYPDDFFDAAVCGWVLEHLPDPRPGLAELRRVLQPDGRLLLLTTEDTFTGAFCSRMWHCRTYNRIELRKACEECGFHWEKPIYFSGFHRMFRLGGIVVELKKRP